MFETYRFADEESEDFEYEETVDVQTEVGEYGDDEEDHEPSVSRT